MSETKKDPQAIDPPENTRADSEMRTDSTEELAKAAVDPPEDTKKRTE